MSETRILETDAVLERVGHDLELYRELVSLFFETYEESFEQIVRAVASCDAVLLGAVAHALKGALANLGAARAQEVAGKLEMCGRQASFENGETLAVEFSHEIDAYREELKSFLGA